jgi:divalent metal cation (Fe/Co/Zn/Cd) transporter
MGFAVLLAIENKRLILGESLASDVESDLRGIVESQESVTHVDDFRTMFIGSGQVLVTADVSFDSGLTTEEVNTGISEMEAAMRERDDRVKTVYIEPEL